MTQARPVQRAHTADTSRPRPTSMRDTLHADDVVVAHVVGKTVEDHRLVEDVVECLDLRGVHVQDDRATGGPRRVNLPG